MLNNIIKKRYSTESFANEKIDQEKENAVRSRISLKDILFSNKFNSPLEILNEESIST